MAKTVFVRLTDDLDGSDAEETVFFALDGKSYAIDLSRSNADRLRKALNPCVTKATHTGRAARLGSRSESSGGRTAFSQLSDDEKARFRTWAEALTARRIANAKVDEWEQAGKP